MSDVIPIFDSGYIIQPGVILSAHIASGHIGSAHLSFQQGATNITSGSIIVTHLASGGLYSGALASGQLTNIMLADGAIGSAALASGQIAGVHLATGALISANYGQIIAGAHIINAGLTSANYASGSIGGPHVAAGAITSAQAISGLAYHMENFIGSTDANGFWSAAWKANFGAAPTVLLQWYGLSGQGRLTLVMSASTTAAYGATLRSGGSGPGTSGRIFILAIG